MITNYADPNAEYSWGITTGPDGALWYTNSASANGGKGSIGRITTAGVVTNYTASTLNEPTGITTGPDGALWFTNPGSNSIGRITTSGAVTNYTGTGINDPTGITTGPDGALWFTNNANDEPGSIGRITTAGTVTNYTASGIAAPYRITTGPDGALWFTNAGSIGRITTSGAVTSYNLSTTVFYPAGITVGPDKALWFSNYSGTIGRITTAGAITTYNAADNTADAQEPSAIAAGPDGALWYDSWIVGDAIGRIKVTPAPKPTFTSAPKLTAPTRVGHADTCAFTESAATTTAIRWLVSGVVRKGATARTFTPVAADLGKPLSCSVTLTNSGGSVVATSAAVKVALGAALTATRKPALSGPHKAGEAEAVSAGTWSPAATSYTYQWYLGTTAIARATSSHYTSPTKDKGKKLHCVVTAHLAGHGNGTYTTPAVTLT